jgi:hypothetical protein
MRGAEDAVGPAGVPATDIPRMSSKRLRATKAACAAWDSAGEEKCGEFSP